LAISFLFLGPAPFLPLVPTTTLIQIVLGLVGFSSALIMVASFLRAHRAALKLGFRDSIDTYIFISGK
jgi:hypothetical protein